MEPISHTSPKKPHSLLTSSFLRSWLPSRGTVLFTALILALIMGAGKAGALPFSAPVAAVNGPSTIAYQGRLADTTGTPLTGTYTMVFRLYSAPSGGAPLWEEQWTGPNSVRVSDGLFNVMLGSLVSIPQTVITGNSGLWLGITVNTDNEMTPRVQLGSVPFAIQAQTLPVGSTASQYYVGTFQTPTVTGNMAVAGVGFQPRLVLFFGPGSGSAIDELSLSFGAATSSSSQFSLGGAEAEGLGVRGGRVEPTNVLTRYSAPGDNILFQAEFVSLDSDGFTINFTKANSYTERVGFIAFR